MASFHVSSFSKLNIVASGLTPHPPTDGEKPAGLPLSRNHPVEQETTEETEAYPSGEERSVCGVLAATESCGTFSTTTPPQVARNSSVLSVSSCALLHTPGISQIVDRNWGCVPKRDSPIYHVIDRAGILHSQRARHGTMLDQTSASRQGPRA